MPGTPRPIVDPRFGPAWTPIIQSAQNAKQQTAALNAGAQNTNVTDGYGNTQVIIGQLNQIITIGATHGQSGVTVSTGFPTAGDDRLHATAGIAFVRLYAWGTITLTAGTNSGTAIVGTPGATNFTAMLIGAANVSDPSTGTPTPALPYNAEITSYTGSWPNYTFTFADVHSGSPANAVESGTGLYFVAFLIDVGF